MAAGIYGFYKDRRGGVLRHGGWGERSSQLELVRLIKAERDVVPALPAWLHLNAIPPENARASFPI
jgi:hypothetical protein